MRGSSIRWTARSAVAVVSVLALATTALAAASWGPATGAANTKVGQNYTWNDGPPMAAKLGTKLIAVYDTDWVNGASSFDGSGTYLGAYATTSTNSGGTWAKAKRLNPGTKHAERATIAAGSAAACASYMTQAKYYAPHWVPTFDPTAPRSIYVRCTSDGSTWGSSIKLPGQTTASRGDYPYMAASGTNFYLVVTNSKTGDIWLWKSANSGGTWTGPTSLGTTTLKDTASDGYVGGFTGLPAVAATGTKVVVAWQTDAPAAGTALYRVSTDGGSVFAASKTLDTGTTANYGYLNLRAAADGRVAAGWSTASAAKISLLSSTTFGAASTLASFPDAQAGVEPTTNAAGFGVIPVFGSGTAMGATWTECNAFDTGNGKCADNYNETGQYSNKVLMSVVYRPSTNGTTWGTASTVIVGVGTKFNQNDWTDALMVNGAPYVFYTSHNATYGNYQTQLKVCSGC